MRIIAGAKRGMRLLSPKSGETRPMTDRVKESLFSILFKYGPMEGKKVADLFCGTGSLGLEALSRGAQHATFVERDRRVIEVLNINIEKAGFAAESTVLRADAFNAGAGGGEDEKYDIVFVDPPYADTANVMPGSLPGKLLLSLSGQITQDGIILVRTRRSTILSDEYGRLRTLERREWGGTAVTILGLKNDR